MVKISPLRGITYNFEKVDAKSVMAPPYDVISRDEQEALYNSSPYNIVRLILGKIYSDDAEQNNRYTRAAKDFDEWLEKGILTKSDKPCIYYYIQNYVTPKGEKISRKGFIARNYIEEFAQGNILPHEYTMGGPKEDRFKLMQACKTNFSQVFMVYSDPEKLVEKAVSLEGKPFIDVVDENGIQNIVYIIDNPETLEKITKALEGKNLLIADGHHRYETALAYRNYMREQNPGYNEDDNFNWVMCYYTNLDDDNLRVFPTHRIITKSVDANELIGKMQQYFETVEYKFEKSNKNEVREKFINDLEEVNKNEIALGLYVKGADSYKLFKIKDHAVINGLLDERQVPDVMKKLDLTVLHKLVITDFLAISEEDQMKQNGIKYIKKEEEAFKAVESDSAELVFLLATPKIRDIKEVSENGFRMPQKSTYFYPKLLSGLVINPL